MHIIAKKHFAARTIPYFCMGGVLFPRAYCPEFWPGFTLVIVLWLGSLDQSGACTPAPPAAPVWLVGEPLLASYEETVLQPVSNKRAVRRSTGRIPSYMPTVRRQASQDCSVAPLTRCL
jgi:hypothetical protein